MDTDILQTITISSFAPATLLFIWKILIPLVNLLMARMSGTDVSSYAKLCKIEGNDLHEIRTDIKELKDGMEYMRRIAEALGTRVAVLETLAKQ